MTSLNAAAYLDAEIAEHMAVALRTQLSMATEFPRLVSACAEALRSGHKLLLFGNGGAAAAAQHIAAELVVRYDRGSGHRRSMAAIALTTDTSALTAIGNDYGYDQVFARQLEGLGRPGDVLVAITTSGRSASVTRTVEVAHRLGMVVIGMTGLRGRGFAAACDLALVTPHALTPRVQEGHLLMGHALCALVEEAMFPARSSRAAAAPRRRGTARPAGSPAPRRPRNAR
jgi:D-sedoheptulose 7-phosphate isomerase